MNQDNSFTAGQFQKYWKEYLITGCFGGIGTPLGKIIRNVIYRSVFAAVGKSVYIQPNVRFVGTDTIELGDYVRIYSGSLITNRGNRIRFGEKAQLDNGVHIRAFGKEGGHIEVGASTYLGPYVCLAGPGPITIGRDCLIASHTTMYANQHIFTDLNTPIRYQGVTRKGIVIEDDCWLGTGVRVLDGVTIGKGSIIGAGAVVTRDIPPYSIAVGVPAQVVRQRRKSDDFAVEEHLLMTSS